MAWEARVHSALIALVGAWVTKVTFMVRGVRLQMVAAVTGVESSLCHDGGRAVTLRF